jgi:hypothetical protein
MGEERSNIAEVQTRMRQQMRMHSKAFAPAVLVPLPRQPQPVVHLFPTLILMAATAGVSWLCNRWLPLSNRKKRADNLSCQL